MADEVHVLGPVASLGLRTDGASRPATRGDGGGTGLETREEPPPSGLAPAVHAPTVLTSGHRVNCRRPWRGPEVRLLLPPTRHQGATSPGSRKGLDLSGTVWAVRLALGFSRIDLPKGCKRPSLLGDYEDSAKSCWATQCVLEFPEQPAGRLYFKRGN